MQGSLSPLSVNAFPHSSMVGLTPLLSPSSNGDVNKYCHVSAESLLLPTSKFRENMHRPQKTQLNAFRPDWARRASRIEKIRKEKEELYSSFKKRQEELGIIGKRYRCRNPATAKGIMKQGKKVESSDLLLNVYLMIPENEVEAKDESNIINRLVDGETVESIGPSRGIWIEHDGGGWSPSIVDGHTRLTRLF
eukprot:CAMPEP_0194434068 /NCGR_PEP_ID=MMETSP0176-20130528/80887_1 /TAXON_ID=216777 /ORGANISM="Proboscia alata, Strain PI-D3" /LENGTH=192 /DNA_ID=CAMNT_0039252017 /DNA_START=32 /DNA_END=610 /DNA_ORIENTATION=+